MPKGVRVPGGSGKPARRRAEHLRQAEKAAKKSGISDVQSDIRIERAVADKRSERKINEAVSRQALSRAGAARAQAAMAKGDHKDVRGIMSAFEKRMPGGAPSGGYSSDGRKGKPPGGDYGNRSGVKKAKPAAKKAPQKTRRGTR